jgi:hypothetical protein
VGCTGTRGWPHTQVAALLRADSDAGGGQLEQPAIELPGSWVPRLSVTRDILDMRVPKGSKRTVYRVSEHDIFALFGESSKFDGCLERLSVFKDEEHQVKVEVRCLCTLSCLPFVLFRRPS